jgi:hypothetical protein
MKFMLMFGSTAGDPDRFEQLNAAEQTAMYGRVAVWMQTYGAKTQSGERLQPPAMATTVRLTPGQRPAITDGPFVEGKEIIGYAVVNVDDLDEALAMAKEWPAQSMVEVRPVLEMAR